MLSLEPFLFSDEGVLDWRGVGSNLGLSRFQLDEIQLDNCHCVKYSHKCWCSVVKQWLRTTPDITTKKYGLKRLVIAMTECGETAAAKRLRDKAGKMTFLVSLASGTIVSVFGEHACTIRYCLILFFKCCSSFHIFVPSCIFHSAYNMYSSLTKCHLYV